MVSTSPEQENPASSSPENENEEDPAVTEAKEKEQITNYVSELKSRLAEKEEARRKNENIIYPEETKFSKLDSSLKKSTALVRKLKSFTEQQLNGIIKEVGGLNLEKYISEIAAALIETKLKLSDVSAAIVLCTLLHETYPDFSKVFFELWHKAFSFKREEKIVNPSKLRVDLRFYSDLLSAGILPQKDAFMLLKNVLSFLTSSDRDEHANCNIILSFCKHCAEDYAGISPKRMRELSEKYNVEIPKSNFLSSEKHRSMRMMLVEYYMTLCAHMESEYKELQKIEKDNRKILQTKGELSNDRKEKWESVSSTFQKLHNAVLSFSDVLDEPVPELKEDKLPKDITDEILTGECDSMLTSLWEDDESRKFYEEFPDVTEFLPSVKQTRDHDTTEVQEEIEEKVSEEKIEKVADSATNVHTKADFENFLNHLLDCVNKEMIDNAAVEFLMYYNNKNHRKKLVKTLFNVPRTRLDLLPFLSRFVAILSPVTLDVANELVSMLKSDFKYHLKKKDQINIETKIKVIRFIGELVKFGLYTRSDGLYCLKDLLHDFTHHHIEMVCNFLETAGRYLYHNADSHQRLKVYMEQMMRKKQIMNLSWRYSTMIENAYYYVNPPEMVPHHVKKKTPIEEFISRLLYRDLHADDETEARVLLLMRKLDWDNKNQRQYAINCLTSAWKVTYFNIRCLANLLAGLVEYQELVGTQVIDNVLEDIRLGLETNSVKMNQRRVAMIKYLGELYNYRMVESNDIFKVLYSLISYGVSFNYDIVSPLDPASSTFRLRLVCVLLDTCGQYFNHGTSRIKLDYFIVYFQHYFMFKCNNPVWSAENPFPIIIKYMVRDTLLNLRPNIALHETYEDAKKALDELQLEFLNKLEPLKFPSENGLETILEANDDFENEEESDRDDRAPTENEDEDQNEVSIRISFAQMEDPVEKAAEAEFLENLDKMVTDSIQSRTSETVRVQLTDISVPYNVRNTGKKNYDQLQEQESKQHINFTMLCRKGNKQQCKSLQAPVESELAQTFKSHEKAAKVEMERVKKLTLDISGRLEEEDYQESMTQRVQKQVAQPMSKEKRHKKDSKQSVMESDQSTKKWKDGGKLI